MQKNYQSLQAKYFPNNPTNCSGDPSIYLDLIWISGQVSQSDLDDKWIEYLKEERYYQVDDRTDELIELGYSYAGKQFSLSASAKTNILAIHSNRSDPALIYPIEYNTINDLDNFFIPNLTVLHEMFLAAFGTTKAHLDSGSALKDLIRVATTEQEINLIIDNR
jgi:hypothetical protein